MVLNLKRQNAVLNSEFFKKIADNPFKELQSAPSINVNVDNLLDIQYKTEIYLGSNYQAFDVQIDTGSNILVIMNDTCTECQYTFSPGNSTTF